MCKKNVGRQCMQGICVWRREKFGWKRKWSDNVYAARLISRRLLIFLFLTCGTAYSTFFSILFFKLRPKQLKALNVTIPSQQFTSAARHLHFTNVNRWAFYERTAQLHSDYTICHCHMRSISLGPQSLSQPITWFVLSIRFSTSASRNRVESVPGLVCMPMC